jgi:hypothetical protein
MSQKDVAHNVELYANGLFVVGIIKWMCGEEVVVSPPNT